MPVALGLIALRLAWGAADRWPGRVVALGAIAAAFGLGMIPSVGHSLYLPILALMGNIR